MILHIDMDAFFASIEQAVNPRLKGKPLIVGSRDNKMHTVVCAASYEAKALGIDSGMPSFAAFKLCPKLEFVAADQSKYIWTSEEIFKLLKDYQFQLNYASIDEFQMDIKSHPQPQELANDIKSKIYKNFKITASIGVAKNWLIAKLASKLNKPNGITIITEENLLSVLKKTPAERLCGVGKSTTKIIHNLGLKTCLDLYQKDADFLEKNLGQNGLNLYVSLHSTDSFETDYQETKPKSVGHSYTLPRATKTPRFIQAWLRLLAEMVAQRLRQKNLISETIFLWLNGPEIGNFTGQKTFTQATNDGFEIYSRALKIMAQIGQESPKIRAFGITCSKLTTSSYPLLFNEQKRREALTKAMDIINNRHGESTIFPAITIITKENL
jgi:DNA polymerase-4